MKRFLSLYPYLGPLVLIPLAAYLWWGHYGGNWALVGTALLVPVIHAYVVPGVGTNVLGMWEFNTRLRIGRFRPHHGFVFGSATAVISLPLMGEPLVAADFCATLSTAFSVGALLLVVNWIYDALAMRHGILSVYTESAAQGASPWRIASDYVWWFFGLFGVLYAGGLCIVEPFLTTPNAGRMIVATLIISTVCIIVTSTAYVIASFLLYGHLGLRPMYAPVSNEVS